jgi:hypothetical protein
VELIHDNEQSGSIGLVEIFETKVLKPSGEYGLVPMSSRPIYDGLAHCPASSDQNGRTDIVFPGVITAQPVPSFLATQNDGLLSVGWTIQPIYWPGYDRDFL